jgi:transcriptional regulator with XRE-family HTH domain
MADANTIVKKVGKRIKYLREQSELSQEKLALKAGLNRAYIGYIERGERNPSITTLAKIADVLEVEIKELFEL